MKSYLSEDLNIDKFVDVLDDVALWSAPFGLKLLDYIDYRKNISAIDIGFGNGFPLTELAMRLGEGSTVYGIDPWQKAIERVNRKIDLYGITNIKIIEGVAESIPLDNESIDLITSNNGINNVQDIEKVFLECSRILIKGGQFIQTMNLDTSMSEFYEQFEAVLSDLNLEKEIDLMHRHIALKRPPLENIISFTEMNGFVIKDLEHDQFNYKFADATAMFRHFFIRIAFMDSWIEILPADKVEQVFDMIELRLNEQSHRLGRMNLSIPFVMINAVKG